MTKRTLLSRHFWLLLLPLAGLVTVAALLIGQLRVHSDLHELAAEESAHVQLGKDEIVERLRTPQQHLMSLQKERPILAAIDDPSPVNRAGMSEAFASLLDRNPEYDQARWIDEKGMERVRVDRGQDGTGPVVIAEPNLQDKADRDYVVDTAHLGIGGIYISQLDLNIEHGKLSIPYRPTLRFAIAIADRAGVHRGILVINYLADPMLKNFKRKTGWGDRNIMLLNRQGYWLASPNPADEWGFMFGRAITLGSRSPEAWARISRSEHGQFIDASGLWSWETITPLAEALKRLGETDAPTLIVVSHLPAKAVRSVYFNAWLPTALIGILSVLILATLSWYVALRSEHKADALKAEAAAEESRRRVAVLEADQRVGARLAAIIESTDDAIVGKNLDGTITSWNPGAEKLFGYRADEAIGHGIQTLLAPGREEEERQILERIERGETVGHFETVRRHKDGHPIDVSVTISPIRDAAGRVIGASKIARDITAAKRAETELSRHREHLEELVEERTAQIAETTDQLRERQKFITTVTDNLPSMVGYWDRDLRCRFANRAYFDWFGRTSEQMLGTTIEALLGEERFQSNRPAIEAVLGGEPQQFELEIRKPSGELGYGFAHYIPDREGDAVIGFFVLVADVTPLKLAEGELRHANDKLEEALAGAKAASSAKSQFVANMSHEIRTPMNGVIGMLEILGHTKLDDDQARIIGTVRGSARSLLEVINDILDFSKIEAGYLKIEVIAADPTEIIESTARLFLGAAAAKGLVMRSFVAPSVRGQYLTDPVRLRQILSNLVSNAIKFTSSGGVTMTVDVAPGDDEAACLCFVVEDTGIGISREAQARLFQPFTQADDSTARKFGGTGLGLSICLRLVDLMGGKIGLDSVEGEGTRVTLTLPARPVESDAETTALDLHGVRVALVTSDKVEQRYFHGYLTHWGAEVTVMQPGSRPATPPPESFTLILAPLVTMEDIRLAAEGADEIGIPVGAPMRFVFYSYDDPPVDRNPTNDSIETTALSRARIITAVAVAAGRMSPETEIVQALPLLASHGAAPSRDQAIKEGRLILLAEDHPVNRDVTLRQLRLLGYAADAVEDGSAALAALTRTRYALLLTDCNMPEMDGFALTRRIRQAETGGFRLPIIALTANALDGEDQKCFAAGMDDYLSKPVEMATLRSRLDHWLSAGATNLAQTIAAPTALRTADDTDTAPALSLAVLAEYCGDDPAAVSENLKLFVDTMRVDLERLSAAIAQSNADETQLLAHRMKGAARIVGGQRLATCSEAVELAAEARDWAAVERDMPLLLAAAMKIDQMYDEIASA